jgi:hypothetical protein
MISWLRYETLSLVVVYCLEVPKQYVSAIHFTCAEGDSSRTVSI